MFLSYILREEEADFNNKAFGHYVIFSGKKDTALQVG